jgi:hypothetical protein
MRKAGLDESTVLRGCSGALKDTSAGGFGVDTKQAMPEGRPLTVRISAASLGWWCVRSKTVVTASLIGIWISSSSLGHLNGLENLRPRSTL